MSNTSAPNKQKIKKEVTYTYWVDENNKSRQLPPEQRPKKIEVCRSLEPQPNHQKPSAWNSCGTWEERTVSLSSIEAKLTTELKQWLATSQMCEIELEKVSLEGEVQKIYKKQKWSLMYEITGKIEFKKDDEQGGVKLEEITDNGDQHYSISGAESVRSVLSSKAETILHILKTVVHAH